MSRRLKSLHAVVDWGFCVGCGACAYACPEGKVTLLNLPESGIRPRFKEGGCKDCNECLSFCPGAGLSANGRLSEKVGPWDHLIGPALEIWEGYSTDEEIRFMGSSGGVLTALSLYCLEKEGMDFVLHTGSDPDKPWLNKTVRSKNRAELLERSGSRYSPSSPCEALRSIEESEKPCLFIGKPCDAAAVAMLRRRNQRLDDRLGLVLTFFCAGPPGTQATLNLIEEMGMHHQDIKSIRYRGMGWPGEFKISSRNGKAERALSYEDSWRFLAGHRRSFRCHLCPDGLGELADISCGDAWHRYEKSNPNHGISIVMARSQRGKEILHRAQESGYLHLEPSGPEEVIRAQGMVERRKEIMGRLSSLKLFFIPTPRFSGFYLEEAWREKPLKAKLRTFLGTIKRIIRRKMWRPKRISRW
jgi:coenzyme F420 hydrogenase subunit beta